MALGASSTRARPGAQGKGKTFVIVVCNGRGVFFISAAKGEVLYCFSIKFRCIKNRDEIYEVVSKLLMERQTSKMVFNEPSPADELKKYKELLDTGAISQDEFETKKNQLLNL